jgi:mannitol-1-phosphate 5-dehydrogenase
MQKVIQFGAGKIGRGFLGELFSRSGYETIFVDVDSELIDLINEKKVYRIKILRAAPAGGKKPAESPELVEVKNISGINAADVDRVTDALSQVNLSATAVGAGALKSVSKLIALGVEKRYALQIKDPLNIIICENLPRPAMTLKNYIFDHLDSEVREYASEHLGLVESVVSRMVPDLPKDESLKREMQIEAEEYGLLPVARKGFNGTIPKINGMVPYDNLEALVERKLYMHNAGHALCSYWGYLKGYKYVYEAVRDEFIKKMLFSAMEESAQALCRKHGFTDKENTEYGEDLIRRFDNKGLMDTVERGARDPVRKLGKEERLVGAASLALEYGIEPVNLSLGIAAAFLYDNRADKTTDEIVKKLGRRGIDFVLRDICLLDPEEKLALLIKKSFDELELRLGIIRK